MTTAQHLQQALRAAVAGGASRVGPFLVALDPDATGPGRNFAVPDEGAAPSAGDIAALVEHFESHDRWPRLEFVRPAPALEQALGGAGFTEAQRFPLLVADALVTPVAAPPGVRIAQPATDDDLRDVCAVQNRAYGEPGVSAADVTRLRRGLDHGGDVVAAYAGDAVVGAGQAGAPHGGFAEIHSVATEASHRRRGIASAVVAELSARAAARDVTTYLQAEGADEQRMYERLGYRAIGELVDLRAPVLADPGAPRLPAADEATTQLAFLDYLRTALAGKLIGLGEDDARRAPVPSGTSLLWLAKHVAGVEAFWLHHIFAGDPEQAIPDDEDLDADTVGSVLTVLRRVGERSAQIVVEHPDLGELGRTTEHVPVRLSLRWTLAHLVEETGRHAGHADILRELIDGTVGR